MIFLNNNVSLIMKKYFLTLKLNSITGETINLKNIKDKLYY